MKGVIVTCEARAGARKGASSAELLNRRWPPHPHPSRSGNREKEPAGHTHKTRGRMRNRHAQGKVTRKTAARRDAPITPNNQGRA